MIHPIIITIFLIIEFTGRPADTGSDLRFVSLSVSGRIGENGGGLAWGCTEGAFTDLSLS